MSNPDFFGYTKNSYDSKSIASANMVVVSITDGTGSSDKKGGLCLVQSAEITYQRTVTPIFELGSDSVWMVAGSAQGTARLSRILGKKGDEGSEKILKAFKPSDACKGVTITLAEGEGNCGLKPGKLICESSILNHISASVSIGQLALTETANYTVGKVSIS